MFKLESSVDYGNDPLSRGRFDVDINAELTPRVVRVLERFNFTVLKRMQALIGRQGTGRHYPSKRADGSMHQASAPGAPPAKDTGAYQDSWETDYVTTPNGETIIATIYSTLWGVFGRRLELGGHGGGVYIAPRPHVRPALESAEPVLEALLEDL